MNRELQTRFLAVLLALLTAGSASLAWINFRKGQEFQVPSDGVWWVERGNGLSAEKVEADGPGDKGGLRVGDRLSSINEHPVGDTASLSRELYATGAWSKVTYTVVRNAVPLESVLILVPAEKSLNYWLRFIALIYLGIGLYVLLRRWTAPGSMHFYIFCLVSFILYSFKYTGKLNLFDWVVYWSEVGAGILQPALFLHFVMVFPQKRPVARKHGWVLPLLYLPGAVLCAIHVVALRTLRASEVLRWNLDRLEMGYLAVYFVSAALLLYDSYRHAETTILRQQLKWVTRGTILAITPYTLFYVIPYM
ncbi:MAG: PDZ domain-containing protein, partial [Acidobacteriales bacterium]|nr:PDZ domain-containing protein [Terriglobales bacterium]